MKKLYLAFIISAAVAMSASAQSLTSVSASSFTGANNVRSGFSSPQGNFRPYDTTGNLALAGGLVRSPVVSSTLPGFSTIHNAALLNDGFYGNGTSWIGNSANAWLKIDLGQSVLFDRVWLGRDRTGGFDDRDPGQFTIAIASADNAYADGDETNDTTEYTTVFSSSVFGFSGVINGSETLQARLASPLSARFIKITLASNGADLDEVQIFNGSVSAAPEPTTLALLALGATLAMTLRRRRNGEATL